MKKLLGILLAGMMLLSVSACGEQEAKEPEVYYVTKDQPHADNVIEFNKVVAEDENVKIELISFVEEYHENATPPFPKYVHEIATKVHNKSNDKLTVFLSNAFIDDESITYGLDSAPSIPAGKTDINRYSIKKEGSSGEEPLDSINDLYRLNGTFQVVIHADNGNAELYNLPFAFAGLQKNN